MEPNLAIGHVLSRAWEAFKTRPGLILAAALIAAILGSPSVIVDDDSGLSWAAELLQFFLGPPLAAGMCMLLLNVVRGNEPDIGNIFDGFRRYGKSMGVYYMYAIIVVLGFVALIIPGIIALVGLLPAVYMVLDKDYDAVDTIKKAWEMTNGHKGDLFVLGIILVLITLAGLFAFIIGVFFTYTFTLVAQAVVYDELLKAEEPDVFV